MGSREQAVMGFESRVVSARVTKHFVSNFSKTFNNGEIQMYITSAMSLVSA